MGHREGEEAPRTRNRGGAHRRRRIGGGSGEQSLRRRQWWLGLGFEAGNGSRASADKGRGRLSTDKDARGSRSVDAWNED